MQRRSVRAQCPREPPAERLRHPDSRTRAIRCVAMCRQGARCGIAPGRPEFFTASLYRPPLRDAACPYREQRCCLSPDRPAVCHPNRAVFCCVPVSVSGTAHQQGMPHKHSCVSALATNPRADRADAPMPGSLARTLRSGRLASTGCQPGRVRSTEPADTLRVRRILSRADAGQGLFLASVIRPPGPCRHVRVVMSVPAFPCRHFRAGFPGRPPVRSLLPATLSPSRSPSCCKRSRKSPCRSARSSSASRCRFV